MKRDIMNYLGVLFTILLGTLLHFTYALSGENQIVAVFSTVNESTWEHLKLLFWPTFLWSLAEYFVYGKNYRCFFSAKLISFLVGAAFIIAGLAAEGTTEIDNIRHIQRGYEDICGKLRGVGADIELVTE